MERNLATETFQLCVVNLTNSPAIGCAPQAVPWGCNSCLDLKYFSRQSRCTPRACSPRINHRFPNYFALLFCWSCQVRNASSDAEISGIVVVSEIFPNSSSVLLTALRFALLSKYSSSHSLAMSRLC